MSYQTCFFVARARPTSAVLALVFRRMCALFLACPLVVDEAVNAFTGAAIGLPSVTHSTGSNAESM